MSSGNLRVSSRGQMSLPSAARHRWDLDQGGDVAYLDLGDSVILVRGGTEVLWDQLLDGVTEEVWADARAGFGDDDLADP